MSTVLVADDNPLNRKLALLVLRKAGHEVLEAADGESALRMAQAHAPAVVVLDVQMPGLDGLETVRLLRADPATAGIKALALTALAMRGDPERILAAGFDGYLTKPFNYPDLVAAVASLQR